jgi:hypothetical protein
MKGEFDIYFPNGAVVNSGVLDHVPCLRDLQLLIGDETIDDITQHVEVEDFKGYGQFRVYCNSGIHKENVTSDDAGTPNEVAKDHLGIINYRGRIIVVYGDIAFIKEWERTLAGG